MKSPDAGFAPGGSPSVLDPGLILVISPTVKTLAVTNSTTFSGGGGQTPYSFSIQSGGGSVDPLTGVFTAGAVAGATIVRLTDSLGATATAIVTVNAALSIAPASQSVVVTGIINFSASNGVPPYTYSVFSGGGSVNAAGVYTASAAAGSAIVRVTDSAGNTADSTVTINNTLAISPVSVTLAVINTFTFGALGGQAPYVFAIQSGGGVINSSTGFYTAPGVNGSSVILLTDSLGATATASVNINPALTISPATVTMAVNGAQTFSGSNGVSPYTYSVVSGGGVINSSSGAFTASAAVGAVVIRVTDSLGNTANSSVSVVSILAINPTSKILAVNNSFTFSGLGGQIPYLFSIQSGGGTINSATGAYTAASTSGSAVVLVTDAIGQTATANVTVNAALAISPVAQAVALGGTINYVTSGGVSPYTYSVFSGGGSITPATGVYTAPGVAGSAIVRVTDAFGNFANSNVTVNNALGISPAAVALAVNNSITFSNVGGTGPYVFTIQSGGGVINSSTGFYTAPGVNGSSVILLTDSLGATATANVNINPALTISPATVTMAVNGAQTFSGSNGVSPYTYSVVSGGGVINSSSGVFTAPAAAGAVVIRVTDSLGNTANSSVSIVSILAINPISKILAVNNSFTFSGLGGQSPYSFSMQSGGGTINSATGAYTAASTSGSAVVLVTDAIGQTATANVTINAALAISPVTRTLAVSGTINYTTSGGVSPYTYSIFSGSGTVVSASGVYTAANSPGSAVVRVTDSLGNTSDSSVTVNPALGISPAAISVSLNNTYTFSATGGTAPFIFSILSGGGVINASTGLYTAPNASGSAVVEVTDALGATATANVTINSGLAISPATTSVAVNGTRNFTVTGGVSAYTYSVVSGGGVINASTGIYTASAVPGSVVVRVTDSLANISNASVTVVSVLTISPTTTTLAANNSFTFSGSGGQTPYSFSIQSGTGTINSATGVYVAPAASGSDVVRITDAIGQTATATVTINNALSISPTSTAITLANTVTFAASGGVPTSTYSVFSGPGSVNSGTGLYTPTTTGSATVRATDSLGNISDGTVMINANLAISPATANVVTDGTITFNPVGGVPPLTYSLVSGTGIVDPVMGDFTAPSIVETDVVRVTDSLGNFSDSTITTYLPLTLSPLSVTVAVSGSQTFTATDGKGARTFSLVSGGGSINATTGVYSAPITAGSAVIRVSDALLNTVDANITIVSSLSISPATLKLPVFSTATFTSVLAVGSPTYSVISGGGSIVAATGAYTGGPLPGAAVVRVTDTAMNTSNSAVTHVEPIEIESGAYHTCVRYNDGSVKCWGLGSSGQLGQGATTSMGGAANQGGDKLPFVNLGTGRTAVALALGDNHSCALLDNATVKCWGLNSSGQLGLGDITNRGTTAAQMGNGLPAVNLGTGRTALNIFAFGSQTCAKLDNSALKCWGLNSSGQLGLGDIVNRGTSAAQMGDALLAVNLGTGRSALKVGGGFNFACARLDNNTAKCWGNSTNGQTGYESTATRGNAAGQMGDVLPAVNLGTGRTVIDIESGYSHSCAILDNNALKCWGRSQRGELGYDNTTTKGAAASTMGDLLAAVNLGFTVAKASLGRQSSCAMSTTSTLKCWGLNSTGQLLKGNTTNIGSAAGQMAALTVMNLGTSVTSVAHSRGYYFGCFIASNKRIKCYGSAANGSLLNASTTLHLGDAAGEIGDGLPFVNH